MDGQQSEAFTASCRCGSVVMEMTGAPIVHAICYCTSCQEAGRQIAALPNAPPVLGADGGSEALLFRKDRCRCVKGGDMLQEHRLKPGAPTRRMVATCCNSLVFLDYTKGHWLSVYHAGIAGPVPPLEMRVMVAERPQGVVLPDDVPSYPKFPGKFIFKLLGAWAAMGFRTPRVPGLSG